MRGLYNRVLCEGTMTGYDDRVVSVLQEENNERIAGGIL